MNDPKDDIQNKKVSIDPKKNNYVEQRSPSGTKSFSNGDSVAKYLRGLSADKIYQVADKLFPDNDFREKYKDHNVGMQRMIIGNRIRNWISNADKKLVADKKEPNSITVLAKITAPMQKNAEKLAATAKSKKDTAKEKSAASS